MDEGRIKWGTLQMPEANFGALTIPIFCSIFGAGWGMCYKVLVQPLTARVQNLEAQVAATNAARDTRLAALERKAGIID